MRILSTLFFLCLTIVSCPLVGQTVSGSNLSYLYSPVLDCQLLEPGRIIACGNYGVFSVSDDAGETWEHLQSGFSTDIFVSMYFISPDRGWAAATNGRIIETNDGGQTWTELREANTGENIEDITMAASGRGFAVGQSGVLLRSLDFGKTWESLGPPTSGALKTVQILSEDDILVAGSGHPIISRDGGDTWSEINAQLNGNPLTFDWKSSAVNANNSVVLGGASGVSNVLLHSTDLGASWQQIPIAVTANLVGYNNETILIWESPRRGRVSYDEGSTWQELEINPPFIGQGPFAPAPTSLVLGENFSLIFTAREGMLRSDGNALTWDPLDPFLPSASIFTGLFFDQMNGIVSHGQTELLQTANGGKSWQSVVGSEELSAFAPADIAYFNDDLALLVGGSFGVARWTAEQDFWAIISRQPQLAISNLTAVEFASESQAMAVGWNQNANQPTNDWIAATTTDGGLSWQNIDAADAIDVPFGPEDLLFLGAERWLAVGGAQFTNDAGMIALSTDNGSAWEYVANLNSNRLWSAASPSPGVIVAVGEGGSIVRSTDNGDTWALIVNESANTLHDVEFIDALNGIAVGEDIVLVSNDGGGSWVMQSPLDGLTARECSFVTANTAYLLGTGFGLMRLTIDTQTSVELHSPFGTNSWDVALAPNPTSSILRTSIHLDELLPRPLTLRIVNAQGIELPELSQSIAPGTFAKGAIVDLEFDISTLANGVYFLVSSDGIARETKRFVMVR